MHVRRALFLSLAAAGLTACAYECIYIYGQEHKACGNLEPVVTIDRGGNEVVLEEDGVPPFGCVCLDHELEPILADDSENPALDGLYADIQAEARAHCVELALAASADPTPCESAALNKVEVFKTDETYEECKFLAGTIDEDKDGYCPVPEDEGGDEVGTETGETGTNTGDTGTNTGDTDTGLDPVIPDLPLDFP